LLAKKTKQVAISLGCDGRPMGAVNCLMASSLMVAGMRGVHTGPGAYMMVYEVSECLTCNSYIGVAYHCIDADAPADVLV
jgi:hypothetical protein